MEVRSVTRYVLCFAAMTATAALVELARGWPSSSAGVGFAAALALQVIVLTALWTAPAALVAVGAAAAVRKLAPRRATDSPIDISWLGLVPPATLACVTAGQSIHAWSARAFVRQDLAGAVVPALQLVVFAGIAAAAAVGYRWQRSRLHALPRWSHVAAFAATAVVALVCHLARFPAILDDALLPVALQVAGVAGVATGVLLAPRSWLKWRPGYVSLAIAGGVTLALLVVMLFGGRIAPLSYPVASAAIQTRGLAAARIAGVTARIGDGDGDGFSRFFGGLDCDDDDAAINPFAKDSPGNGVDEDCFEGDLAAAAVEADKRERAAGRARPPRQRARNAILITVDALRADAVGFGGATHPTSPTMDRLAAGGAVFARAYSQAPMTRKAFPALLSGQYPANVHWLDLQTKYPYPVSHDDNLYLAEVASDAGLATGSVVAFNYARNSRFNQGFDIEAIHPASRFKHDKTADRIAGDGVAMIRRWHAEGKRFFLWLHFYEAHFPYVSHKPWNFGASDRERYLSEVRWIDHNLAGVVGVLDELGIRDDTAIVFTGDHGEEFGEHGGEHHGDLFTEDLHVPLLIAGGGVGPGRYDAPVGLVDVAPTIAELLGIAIPESFDGDSLVPWLEGQPPPANRLVYAELVPDRKVPRRIMTLIGERWQLIVDFELGTRQLFDLELDPSAQRNALVDAPAQARRLETALRRRLALRVGPIELSYANTK